MKSDAKTSKVSAIAKASAATKTLWAGEEESLVMGATQVPIVYSAAYGYADVDEWLDVALGRKPGHIYSRNTNPTVHAFEEKVRILEGAEAATSFSTGMAAISNTLFTLLVPRRSRRLGQGYLRRHEQDFHRVPAALQRGRNTVRHYRPRADRSRHRQGLQGALSGDAHQPHAESR